MWALLTAGALLTPGPQLDRFSAAPDWTALAAHLVLFSVLSVLLVRSLGWAGVRRHLFFAVVLSFLYGAALEIAQIAVEGRQMDLLDFVANGLGAVVGGVGAGMARRGSGQ